MVICCKGSRDEWTVGSSGLKCRDCDCSYNDSLRNRRHWGPRYLSTGQEGTNRSRNQNGARRRVNKVDVTPSGAKRRTKECGRVGCRNRDGAPHGMARGDG